MFAWRRRAVLATLVLLAVFGGVLEGFLPHTDDGCPTEIHCLVCRNVSDRTAIAAAPPPPRPAVVAAPAVPADSTPRVVQFPPRAHVSRGPPFSS